MTGHIFSFLGFLAVPLVFLASDAVAVMPFSKTPAEIQMCQAVIYSRKVPNDPNWAHMHHYCDCVRFTNRALSIIGKKNQSDFGYYLTNAIDGCDYVLSHTTKDFKMRGEVHAQKGKALLLRGKHAQAAVELSQAIFIDPTLHEAFVSLSDFYIKTKNTKKALEVVTEGLRHNPSVRGLQRRYQELGGELPYPAPYVTADKAASAKENTPGPKEGNVPAPAVKGDGVLEKQDSAHSRQEMSAPPIIPVETENTPPPKSLEQSPTRSPTNPFCRFCP